MHYGSHGSEVLALQYLLNHYPHATYRYRLAVDGVYGPKTHRAVDDFEATVGLQTAGVAKPEMWRTLICLDSGACRWTGRILPRATLP